MTSGTPRALRQAASEQELTKRVERSFDNAGDERFRQLMTSLVRHLHAFARDVRLTEREWQTAVEFLTRTGQTCGPTRQEFILLSDVLGLSMMTVAINSPASAQVTDSTVFGPFFVDGSPPIDLGGTIASGVKGAPCWISGSVVDEAGTPVARARVEVWEADADGRYDVQYSHAQPAGRGHLYTDDEGRYRFWSVVPAAYPIPGDGPVGGLLNAANRSPMRPAHVHFMVTAPGLRPLITHIFVAGGAHLDDDAVFAVKDNLITTFAQREPGTSPDGSEQDQPWFEARFDIVLAHAEDRER